MRSTRRDESDWPNFWRVDVDERPEFVVVAVDGETAGRGWELIGSALETARQVVARDGRILVLTDVADLPSAGFRMLRESRIPRDVLKPLRQVSPPDLLAVTQVARALDWANVYLLSQLTQDAVEELFMVPVGNLGEVKRLLDIDATCAFLGSAQHTHAHVAVGASNR